MAGSAVVAEAFAIGNGVVLTMAIAVAMLFDVRLPLVSGGAEQTYLAALMIRAGR